MCELCNIVIINFCSLLILIVVLGLIEIFLIFACTIKNLFCWNTKKWFVDILGRLYLRWLVVKWGLNGEGLIFFFYKSMFQIVFEWHFYARYTLIDNKYSRKPIPAFEILMILLTKYYIYMNYQWKVKAIFIKKLSQNSMWLAVK